MLLETSRLLIRPFVTSDLTEFEKLLDIPEVPGWQMQKSNSEGFLNWHIANYSHMDIINGIVCFGIFDKLHRNVVGAVGAGEHDDLHEPEICYNLLPEARGKGYAIEAAMAVTEWAMANYKMDYIIGTATVDNIPSQRVLENCNYQFIDERILLIHITNEKHKIKYYRFYRE
ncbi:GNAT family N-acetyltransferase [Paenibacillus dokdonensis]|uniref:GNAT family N-acetyltransferase n=1 Tax=Paenibacillus dokdonensis TaxID=2567944 RepID=A0ABU6GIC5_9BACL|nr:GNAT family N-acetyltransferase [Paenibacillus dokdonensis]MEC0238465.1 GNAT family N-acetyltransferase [Paenibacillus dokdonensis]